MSIKSNWLSSCGLLAVVTACLLFTGCGFHVQVKEPIEPFAVDQPLLNVIQLNVQKMEVDSAWLRGGGSLATDMVSQKLSKVLKQSGVIGDVRLDGTRFGIRNPTLNVVAQVEFDSHPWARFFKALLGVILLPLLPFFDVTYDATLTADIQLLDTLQPAGTRVSSNMTVTHKLFTTDAIPRNTLPLLAEDLSWKIALELKRHPAWLRPASPAGTP